VTCIQESSSLTHFCTDFTPLEIGAHHDRYWEGEVAKAWLRVAELCQRCDKRWRRSTASLIVWDVKVAFAIFSL
jgi:hypothetical protein